MNYLVFLDAWAGELEKILSGVKSMVVKEIEPKQAAVRPVKRGDILYFLRNKDECDLRVKATVKSIQLISSEFDEDLSHYLKEMQAKLQLTEEQYNYWSIKKQVLLVEFECAQKLDVIHVAPSKIVDKSDWIAFDDFKLVTQA
jgi:uncharacterized protein Yka (UPF0111/DUF47 family)